MTLPSSLVQGSSWTCLASCAPSGAAFPNDAVERCLQPAAGAKRVKPLAGQLSVWSCKQPQSTSKRGCSGSLIKAQVIELFAFMNQGVLEQARDAWILEYGKFIVALLLMFQHQREPVPINKAVGS